MPAPLLLTSGPWLLRPFASTDADAFVEAVHESTDTVGKWMPWATPTYSRLEALAWFDTCNAAHSNGDGCDLGIFLGDGHLLGGIGLNQFNRAHQFCNLGYWVRQSAQGQGAATQASRLLLRHAFLSLRQHRVEIVMAEGNLASEAVAQKLGAHFEGLARNRILFKGMPQSAKLYSLTPEDAMDRLPGTRLSQR